MISGFKKMKSQHYVQLAVTIKNTCINKKWTKKQIKKIKIHKWFIENLSRRVKTVLRF